MERQYCYASVAIAQGNAELVFYVALE